MEEAPSFAASFNCSRRRYCDTIYYNIKLEKEKERERGVSIVLVLFLVPLAPRSHPTVCPRVELCT
jgi:hypothetical protein